jgi:hypothetical protein
VILRSNGSLGMVEANPPNALKGKGGRRRRKIIRRNIYND